MIKLKFLRVFAKLKLAILFLLMIAGFSIIGTIIEQDQSIDYYQNSYSNLLFFDKIEFWKLLIFFGLDHIYKTWWFLFLLFLFGTCLLSCTFTQQFPTLRLARRCNFKLTQKEFKKQPYNMKLNNLYFFKCLKNFKAKNYNLFHQKNIIYCYKGILGRFAPIIVHIAMLLVLMGNTIAAFGSFNAQELIAKGEIFQIQNTISKSFFTRIPDYPIRVNDFWIEYGTENNIKQFYSNLSILNPNGNESLHKTISVNFPLRFKNLTFYQTDWNIIGLRIKLRNQNYQLPLTSLTKVKNIWVTWIPFNKDLGLTLILNNFNGNFSLYTNDGSSLGIFNIGDQIPNFMELKIFEIIYETGLQIKADPGITLIYFGFGLLIVSSLVSYFSFTQFWLAKTENEFFIGATTNRAKLNLRFEFLNLSLPFKLN